MHSNQALYAFLVSESRPEGRGGGLAAEERIHTQIAECVNTGLINQDDAELLLSDWQEYKESLQARQVNPWNSYDHYSRVVSAHIFHAAA